MIGQEDHHVITVPAKILLEWAEKGWEIPDENWQFDAGKLKPIQYEELSLDKDWTTYNIQHDLTDKGLENLRMIEII